MDAVIDFVRTDTEKQEVFGYLMNRKIIKQICYLHYDLKKLAKYRRRIVAP